MRYEIYPEKPTGTAYTWKFSDKKEAIDAALKLATECKVSVRVMQEIGRLDVQVKWVPEEHFL